MILRIILTILLLSIAFILLIDIGKTSISLTIIRYLPDNEHLLLAKDLQPKSPIVYGLLAQIHEYDQNNINKTFSYEESLKAIELSPKDYRLWLIRAKVLEGKQEINETQLAYQKASQLAPNYFDVFWQWGNFLLRNNKTDEAIICFKKVLLTQPSYANYIFPLLWETTDKNLEKIEPLLTDNEDVQLAFVKLLVTQNIYLRSVELWMKLSEKAKSENQHVANALLNGLMQIKEYDLAWQIWTTLDRNKKQQPIKYQVQNGSFEQPIRGDGLWFDWSFTSTETAKLSRDVGPSSNSHSIKIDYQDPQGASFEHLNQLLLVKPLKQYKLLFSSQATGFISLAPTKIEIIDFSEEKKLLASFSFAPGSYQWKSMELPFNTMAQTKAVSLVIHRLPDCTKNPSCPIFGTLKLSQLSLEEMK